jgi:hypothetical protein
MLLLVHVVVSVGKMNYHLPKYYFLNASVIVDATIISKKND